MKALSLALGYINTRIKYTYIYSIKVAYGHPLIKLVLNLNTALKSQFSISSKVIISKMKPHTSSQLVLIVFPADLPNCCYEIE